MQCILFLPQKENTILKARPWAMASQTAGGGGGSCASQECPSGTEG